ncbi:MAG: HAD family hydrolase [Methyloprofundus sp.]|nr:HAD family hydrolase [Methyloprofundus sp.]MDT8425684.1 HAD family hydrolase [Methyloprofundus sp.]
MNQSLVYALDFDGVICDSAVETALTGWKVATQVWLDMAETTPSATHIRQFHALRPYLETGYEAVIFMRLLQQGESVEYIQANSQQIFAQFSSEVPLLKRLFGQTRDQWIQNEQAEWIAMNPLFPGVAEKLRQLKGRAWYIVTTKQERFVEQILEANQVELPTDTYGLDRRMSKSAVLDELIYMHPKEKICLIEDRLPTLLNVQSNEDLSEVELQFVDWGYNTEQDREKARAAGIPVIALSEFLA